MASNYGKKFENKIRECFKRADDTAVIRLPDQTAGYLGACNICDFIIYHKPYLYAIECKTVHGNTLPFSNISTNQWYGLLDVAKIKGVNAGIICWWVDKDVTMFLPIRILADLKGLGYKSVRFDDFKASVDFGSYIRLRGKKKRVFFDYDMGKFFEEVEYEHRNRTRNQRASRN